MFFYFSLPYHPFLSPETWHRSTHWWWNWWHSAKKVLKGGWRHPQAKFRGRIWGWRGRSWIPRISWYKLPWRDNERRRYCNSSLTNSSLLIDKFVEMLMKTNDQAVQFISAGSIKEALIMLERMEKILEVISGLFYRWRCHKAIFMRI